MCCEAEAQAGPSTGFTNESRISVGDDNLSSIGASTQGQGASASRAGSGGDGNQPGTEHALSESTHVQQDTAIAGSILNLAPNILRRYIPMLTAGEVASDVSSGLEYFLSRRIKLGTVSLANAAELYDKSIDLTDFFSNAEVAEKLKGFAFMRYTAVVDINVIATKKQLCALAFGYRTAKRPLSSNAEDRKVNLDTFQYKTCIFDIQGSPNARLVIPHNGPIIFSDADNGFELGLGQDPLIYSWSYCDLVNSGGGTESIDIDYYMHLTDVKLSHATAQSGPSEHTGKKASEVLGDVSGVAAAVGAVFPAISWVAEPVSWIAGAASWVAHLFGFTRPLSTEQPTPIMLKDQSLSAINGTMHAATMRYDDSTILSKDLVGVGIDSVDPLSYMFFKSSWTYVTHVNWTTAMATNAEIATINVSPYIVKTAVGTNLSQVGFLAACHDIWRGSMEYVVVVLAAFQSGSLRISHDPLGTPSNKHNIARHEILSVEETTMMHLNIPHIQNDIWLESVPYTDTFDKTQHNGVLKISVEAPLKSTDGTSAARVIVFARGGDTLMFSEIDEKNVNLLTAYAQSGNMDDDLFYDDRNESGFNAIPSVTFGAPHNPATVQDAITQCQGEVLLSFRSYLQVSRLVNGYEIDIAAQGRKDMFIPLSNMFPLQGGNHSTETVEGNWHSYAPTAGRYTNKTYTSIAGLLSTMFEGWRGSLVWTIDAKLNSTGGRARYMGRYKPDLTDDLTGLSTIFYLAGGDTGFPLHSNPIDTRRYGAKTIATFSAPSNDRTICNVAVPDTNTKLYHRMCSSDSTFYQMNRDGYYPTVVAELYGKSHTDTVDPHMTADKYVRAGEDFHFVNYCCIPKFNTRMDLA
jgi:hypothetical protein